MKRLRGFRIAEIFGYQIYKQCLYYHEKGFAISIRGIKEDVRANA